MRYIFLALLTGLIGIFPISAQAQSATPVQCGDIIEDEFKTNDEVINYTLDLNAGTTVQVSAVPLGQTLRLSIGIIAPNRTLVAAAGESQSSWYNPTVDPVLNSGVLSANGTYTIVTYNDALGMYSNDEPHYWGDTPGGIGVYTLLIGCTLRDGTVIEPGDSAPDEELASDDSLTDVQSIPDFSGFGFPGVSARDFSEGIELPLTLGQPQTAPLGGDVVLYTYDASAGEVGTLNISRASGDISIGVTVINKDTNEIIFLGGMPSSNNLSVKLTFPTEGTYAIGLFRLDTAERSGTSGAVQIVLE